MQKEISPTDIYTLLDEKYRKFLTSHQPFVYIITNGWCEFNQICYVAYTLPTVTQNCVL